MGGDETAVTGEEEATSRLALSSSSSNPSRARAQLSLLPPSHLPCSFVLVDDQDGCSMLYALSPHPRCPRGVVLRRFLRLPLLAPTTASTTLDGPSGHQRDEKWVVEGLYAVERREERLQDWQRCVFLIVFASSSLRLTLNAPQSYAGSLTTFLHPLTSSSGLEGQPSMPHTPLRLVKVDFFLRLEPVSTSLPLSTRRSPPASFRIRRRCLPRRSYSIVHLDPRSLSLLNSSSFTPLLLSRYDFES